MEAARFDLTDLEDFPDLVFDGVGAFRPLLKAVEVRKELAVHVLDQVVARECLVVIE